MYIQKQSWNKAKKRIVNGRVYDSGFEAGYAHELDLRQKAGEIVKWEAQVTIPLIVNGYKIADYRIDFVVYYPDEIVEYVETKGYATPLWRFKWKVFEALYSKKKNVRLLVVKQRNNFILRKIKKV